MDDLQGFLPLTHTAAPADQAAVAVAVREACAAETPIYPIGGGTTLEYGARPSRPGVGLSLANLTRIVDYPADDLTITVEAGLTIAALQQQLAAQRQRLPIDVAQPERATIGGVVATALAGPRQYACGTIRDYLLGLSAVDGQGCAFNAGGRVVKNAAGYNLCRLMAGSLGTLAVVTQVTLMARPLPETSALVACDVPSFDAAERLLDALNRSEILPAAVELLAGSLGPDGRMLGPPAPSCVARLIAGFEGARSEVQWMADQLVGQWRAAGISSVSEIFDADAASVWRELTDFPAELEIRVPPSRTAALIGQLLQWQPAAAIQAHAGNGVVRARVGGDGFVELLTKARQAASAVGGNAVVLAPPKTLSQDLPPSPPTPLPPAGEGRLETASNRSGRTLSARDIWGPPGEGFGLMRAIKERFDPHGLLNPERFVYEIQ